MTIIFAPQYRSVDIRQAGNRVLVIENGFTILDLPWEAADELARALTIQARRAEEFAKAEQISFDQAILLRAGIPLGLSNNPAIRAEAAKEAAWNSRLRRAMPGGVKSQTIFGTPTIIRYPPHRQVDDE